MQRIPDPVGDSVAVRDWLLGNYSSEVARRTPMLAIEKENLRLKGVLPMQYARPDLNKQRLGELIDLIS